MGCTHAWTQTSLSEDRTRRRRAATASRQERDIALVPGATCPNSPRECGRSTNTGAGHASRMRPGHHLENLPAVRELRHGRRAFPCTTLRLSGAHFPLWSGHGSSSWPAWSPSPAGSTSRTGRAPTWPGKQFVRGSSGASARARSGGSSPRSISSRTAPDTGGAQERMPCQRSSDHPWGVRVKFPTLVFTPPPPPGMRRGGAARHAVSLSACTTRL